MGSSRSAIGLGDVVPILLHEAKDGLAASRTSERVPFFRPVHLAFEADQRHQFTCFSRDVSTTGMGLLHYMAIEPGEVVLTIPSKLRGNIRIRSMLVWCRPCGEGWYLSGVRFLEIIPSN